MSAWLLALALAAGAAEGVKPADHATIKAVETFLETPLAEVPPDAVGPLMELDPESLPKKLRRPFRARQFELHNLRQLAEGRKKGAVRIPESDCKVPQESKTADFALVRMNGYEEASEMEQSCIMETTRCTERDLLCESTLQIIIEVDKKGNRRPRFFYHPRDPISAVLAACRARSGVGRQTNFFGRGGFVCSR